MTVPKPNVHDYDEPQKVIEEEEPSQFESFNDENKTPVEDRFKVTEIEPMAPEKIDKSDHFSEKSPVIFNDYKPDDRLRNSYEEEEDSEFIIIPLSEVKPKSSKRKFSKGKKIDEPVIKPQKVEVVVHVPSAEKSVTQQSPVESWIS